MPERYKSRFNLYKQSDGTYYYGESKIKRSDSLFLRGVSIEYAFDYVARLNATKRKENDGTRH